MVANKRQSFFPFCSISSLISFAINFSVLITLTTCIPQQIFIPGLNIGNSNSKILESNSNPPASKMMAAHAQAQHAGFQPFPFQPQIKPQLVPQQQQASSLHRKSKEMNSYNLNEHQLNDLFNLFNNNPNSNYNANNYYSHMNNMNNNNEPSTASSANDIIDLSEAPPVLAAQQPHHQQPMPSKFLLPKSEIIFEQHRKSDLDHFFSNNELPSSFTSSSASTDPAVSTTVLPSTTTSLPTTEESTTLYSSTEQSTFETQTASTSMPTTQDIFYSNSNSNSASPMSSGNSNNNPNTFIIDANNNIKTIDQLLLDSPELLYANSPSSNNNNLNTNFLRNEKNSNSQIIQQSPRFTFESLNREQQQAILNAANPAQPQQLHQILMPQEKVHMAQEKIHIPQQQQQYMSQPQQQQQSYSMQPIGNSLNSKRIYCSNDNQNFRMVDDDFCNMYHMCNNGLYKTMLCPETYLYSLTSQKCEPKSKVDCGKRMALDFDRSNVPYGDAAFSYMNEYYSSIPSPRVINGSLECALGTDGYFADPEFCNIYHSCLAGVDYADQCPHQLVWNDRKKMCDWQTSVNCTGRIIPVAQGQTSFCTDKSDNKYLDSVYCNVFHHCVGGIDNVVRCDEELQWNDIDKKCDWEGKVKCVGKMLPSDKHYNSSFCIGKPDGPYAHQEYCNVYHVCESGTDNIRQCPNQLFWDYKAKRCDWSGNVECTGRTLITLSTDTTLFCMERKDGVYGDPNWCNVYHSCLSGVDFKTKCPVGLIWNETKKDCDWSDSTQCATGSFLRDAEDRAKTFCGDKPNGKYAHEVHCNRYYVCQNGKDIIFTCQNNLRYNATKQECDWAVNVNCFGKQDYMWEGIKDNFCKSKPDGNYADPIYCNIFHQCQAASDYPKKCSNRLMFHTEKGECDWEDQVDCRGKDKLIETTGLADESKPEQAGDGKGRVTKFCMVKENGNYADLYYCNVYHNCHGGFDTVQYCANGLVWRQDNSTVGTCDWPLNSKIVNGVDCGQKKIFLIDKQSQIDIMATLRSDFCITRGEGLFAHIKYCDLYIHCTAQAVAITMECSPGLIFNEKKRECDYLSDNQMNFANSTYCQPPKQILRPKPKADGTLMFNGNEMTGQFPTKFTCEGKHPNLMHNDGDWCNIYHVCVNLQDNIFVCPPGTVFNKEKQGCFDRYSQQTCSGAVNYYKPSALRKPNNVMPSNNFELYY